VPQKGEPEQQEQTCAAEAQLLADAAALRRFSRRSFLVGAGASSLLAADMLFTRRIQAERRASKILPVPDGFADAYYPDASWFLFPGYKTSWEEALWILNALRGVLNKRGQLAAVGYSNQGLDIDELVIAILGHIREKKLTKLFFYGHSFGGMVATEVAYKLRELANVEVEFILLDSSPYNKNDVLDQSWFDGVVFLYESGVRLPSVVRGGYELGERVIHKDERSWRQILDQSMEQLSPIAPSTLLIQTESDYIYHFDGTVFRDKLGGTRMAFIGNPQDQTIDYGTARDKWAVAFGSNMVSTDQQTVGARPAHASPGWNPGIYSPVVERLLNEYFPLPGGGTRVTIF